MLASAARVRGALGPLLRPLPSPPSSSVPPSAAAARHRPACPAAWACRRRWLSGGRRLPLGDDEDPFEVLGVGVEAEEKEIKAVFYKKAKVLHPDVAGRDTKVEFSRLVRSYEVLMDRSLRAEFLLRRRRRSGTAPDDLAGGGGGVGGAGPWGSQQGRRPPSPVEEFNASIRRGRRAKAQRTRRYYADEEEAEAAAAAEWHRRRQQQQQESSSNSMAPGDADWDLERALSMLDGGVLGKLQEEFDEAVLFAYMGPRVEEGTIPWAFECEERRPLDYDAVAAATAASSAPSSDNDAGSSSSQQQQQQPPSPGILHPHILQMTSGQQLLGFVEARLDGGMPFLPGADSSVEDDEGDDEHVTLRSPFSGLRSVEGKHNYAPLALTWQGSPLAEAVRLRDEGKGEDVIVVKVLQRVQQGDTQSEQEPAAEREEKDAPCYMLRGLDTSALLSQHVVEDARTGQATHLLICHKTPLVRHFHVIQVHDRKVEVRISRGWKPPSHLWHFPPRSADHDIGGFYVERAEVEGARRRAMLLHPAVYILSCAYKTLDREEEERRKAEARAAASSAAPRVARMARDLLQRFM